MGFIYKITCNENKKVYIGQTVNTISKRWSEHQASAKMLQKALAEKRDLPIIQNSVLYRAIVKHGIGNFQIEEVESLPDEKLNEAEIKWIKHYDCIAPKGLNLTSGGGSGYNHSQQTIELMKTVKQSKVDNYRNKKLTGLPAKTAYRNEGKHNECIMLHDHPRCSGKMFYIRDYKSLEEAKTAVKSFLDDLEKKDTTYKRSKRGGDELPKGVCETPKGYRVNKRHLGRNYDRKFEAKTLTKDENKARALAYYEKLMKELENLPKQNNVQRLNVSGGGNVKIDGSAPKI